MDITQLWKNTTEELKIILAPAVFQTFVAKTQLIAYNQNTATIACPNSYLVDMNSRRYHHFFKSALDNQTKTDNIIVFIHQPLLDTDTRTTSGPLFSYAPTSISQSSTANLHPKYTFDNLIVGNSNSFAFAAAQGIVKNPGLSYNPFFIWGGVGVGKTHLMQAIGHELLKNNPSLKIRYFPAETFSNELVQSLKTKTINQFKERYRQLDCILVDDIQFIAGKEYTQEEFFHTFNSLHLNGKQVILTSDRKPSEIDHLEDRLVSRFMGGLTVDIQPPDYEMRLAILRQKADANNAPATPEALQYLATHLNSNIREIEGKLQEIIIRSRQSAVSPIDLHFIQSILHPQTANLSSSPSTIPNPRHLISVCAKHFQIKTSDLVGKARQKDLVRARHITAYLLLTQSKASLEETGHLLGNRDHTSIMHARDKIHQELAANHDLRKTVNDIIVSL